ncbi:uncharacterized protein TNCV_4950281 [Trichonephila clavipes]|nr:uncharacterized protein TNCV_4950281 [Trichonephila clavipes]
MSHATIRGHLAMDLVILKDGQVTRTTPELALRFLSREIIRFLYFFYSRDFPEIACDFKSLLAMLEIFLEIKSAILKASIDIKEEQMMANVEFENVTTIVAGLKPVKIGLEKLCSRNATLLTASFFRYWRIKRTKFREFAKNMKYSLIQRINERRNVNLMD